MAPGPVVGFHGVQESLPTASSLQDRRLHVPFKEVVLYVVVLGAKVGWTVATPVGLVTGDRVPGRGSRRDLSMLEDGLGRESAHDGIVHFGEDSFVDTLLIS